MVAETALLETDCTCDFDNLAGPHVRCYHTKHTVRYCSIHNGILPSSQPTLLVGSAARYTICRLNSLIYPVMIASGWSKCKGNQPNGLKQPLLVGTLQQVTLGFIMPAQHDLAITMTWMLLVSTTYCAVMVVFW